MHPTLQRACPGNPLGQVGLSASRAERQSQPIAFSVTENDAPLVAVRPEVPDSARLTRARHISDRDPAYPVTNQ